MNITQFLLILRARYRIILLTLILVVTATVTVALLLPKTYTATTSLVLNYRGTDPVTGLTLPSFLMPGYMATQIEIIKSKTVALKVVDDLKLADSPVVQQQFVDATGNRGTARDWLATLLSGNVDADPSHDSGVLNISFQGSDPEFAASIANAFATAYQNMAVQLKLDPSQKASTFLTGQIKVLRDNFEMAQRRFSKYQQDNHIDDADNRLDVETARLNELSSQLVAVQGLSIDASSRQKQTQVNAGASPDVMNNALVQTLRGNLSASETRFAEIAQRLSPNHPQYQSAKTEVDKLRSSLNQQIGLASAGVTSNAQIQQQRESQIIAAIAKQREKVMGLNLARDELKLLGNEVQAAQRAYETASNRSMQSNLEARSTQSDVAVLSAAVAPISPTGPKVMLMTLLSIFIGSMLGLGLGIVAEIIDRRVRSSRDLIEVLNVPVLGVLKRDEPKRLSLGFFQPSLPSPMKPT